MNSQTYELDVGNGISIVVADRPWREVNRAMIGKHEFTWAEYVMTVMVQSVKKDGQEYPVEEVSARHFRRIARTIEKDFSEDL